jgi:hypothetical protein
LSSFGLVAQAGPAMKRIPSLMLTTLLMVHAATAGAQSPALSPVEEIEWRKQTLWCVSFVMGFSAGGDELVEVTLSDRSTQSLNAGTGLSLLMGVDGVVLRARAHTLFAGIEGGVKGWNIGGEDTDFNLELVRLPLTARLRYAYETSPEVYLFISSGLQYEARVRLSGSGALGDIQSRFDNALGWVGEAGYWFDSGRGGVSISIRYSRIGYTGVDLIGRVDGSSVGVFLGADWAVFSENRRALPRAVINRPPASPQPDTGGGFD